MSINFMAYQLHARLLVMTGLPISSSRSCDVGDRRPARAGDENAIGVAPFGVEPFGDLVRGMNRQVGELGVFAHAVAGDLQDFEAALFEMALEPLIDLVFVGCADDELFALHRLERFDFGGQAGGDRNAEFVGEFLAQLPIGAERQSA